MSKPSTSGGAKKGATGKNPDAKNWRQATKMVRGGTNRSNFGETAEGLFLTSGYVYASAEEAAARFAGEFGGIYLQPLRQSYGGDVRRTIGDA